MGTWYRPQTAGDAKRARPSLPTPSHSCPSALWEVGGDRSIGCCVRFGHGPQGPLARPLFLSLAHVDAIARLDDIMNSVPILGDMPYVQPARQPASPPSQSSQPSQASLIMRPSFASPSSVASMQAVIASCRHVAVGCARAGCSSYSSDGPMAEIWDLLLVPGAKPKTARANKLLAPRPFCGTHPSPRFPCQPTASGTPRGSQHPYYLRQQGPQGP